MFRRKVALIINNIHIVVNSGALSAEQAASGKSPAGNGAGPAIFFLFLPIAVEFLPCAS
jgi:hypothetical protein